METRLIVREVMSTNLITRPPDTNTVEIAKTMSDYDVGSVIITENGDNEGIVTERDICFKVVARGKNPSKVAARDIMSLKLITISSDKSITDAAKLMVKKGIRRLAVVEKGRINGIITASDILAVSPKTIEVLRELYEIYSNSEEAGSEFSGEISEGGTCESCSVFTDNLTKVDGKYICDDCKEELEV